MEERTHVSSEQWRKTLLAAMANYIDSGSIVAGAVAGGGVVVGLFIGGLPVGADVPASWTLFTETAPAKARGRVAGLAQVLWYVGTLVPLILGIALLGLDDLMPRILFA